MPELYRLERNGNIYAANKIRKDELELSNYIYNNYLLGQDSKKHSIDWYQIADIAQYAKLDKEFRVVLWGLFWASISGENYPLLTRFVNSKNIGLQERYLNSGYVQEQIHHYLAGVTGDFNDSHLMNNWSFTILQEADELLRRYQWNRGDWLLFQHNQPHRNDFIHGGNHNNGRFTVTPNIRKRRSIFTHGSSARINNGVSQEVKGIVIPESKGSYPMDRCPFIALRGIRIDGEDYGRCYVEEYLGDLKSLEGLSRAIVEGSAAAAKVLFLIKLNGTTRAKTLAESPNGAIREGNADDVTVLQLQKFNGFRIAYEQMGRIEERLSFAFLLNSSIQRNAERVTAEEVRFMARELEDALGGLYSILAQEFQLPYVRRKIHQMEKNKKLPALPKDSINPMIITGLEALGRGHDLNKLEVFISGLASTLGPDILAQYMNLDDYIDRRATAIGIDTKGLIKTKEEIAEAQQQAQQQAMISQFGPEVLRQVGGWYV